MRTFAGFLWCVATAMFLFVMADVVMHAAEWLFWAYVAIFSLTATMVAIIPWYRQIFVVSWNLTVKNMSVKTILYGALSMAACAGVGAALMPNAWIAFGAICLVSVPCGWLYMSSYLKDFSRVYTDIAVKI